jgi:dienelactone hydrolase
MTRLTRRSFTVGAAAFSAAACGGRMHPTSESPAIVVDRPSAVIDVPIKIELRGFPPGQPVTLTALIEFADGSKWQSRATFSADARGQVDLTREAPTSGTYDGVAAMEFIWSSERQPGEGRPISPGSVMRPWLVHLDATGPGGTRAQATIDRTVAGPGVTRHIVRDAGIVGTLFLPAGDGPHPAVIVVSGGGGGIPEHRACILASHGYAALALGYFAVEGLPRGLVNIPLEYFENAIRWMRAQPWLGKGFLAVWGPSRGGELALLLGATFPDINAVSAWVPSGVLFWALGLAEPGDTRPRAAWTFRGKPLPYLQENNTSGDPLPQPRSGEPVAYAPFYLSQLRDTQAVERATIPVERTRGPIQLVSGTDDQMWGSDALADIAERRLRTQGHAFPFRHLKYQGAGHLILVPYGPTTLRVLSLTVQGANELVLSQGGTPRLDAEAAVDAWRDLLQFLEEAASRHAP